MSEPSVTTPVESDASTASTVDEEIVAGARVFDPLRFHYIEVLTQQAQRAHGAVRQQVLSKRAAALAALHDDFAQAQRGARAQMQATLAGFPQAAAQLQACFDAGDFRGLQQQIARLNRTCAPAGGTFATSALPASALAALTHTLDQHARLSATAAIAPAPPATSAPSIPSPMGGPGAAPELKVIEAFRSTWSQLSAAKQLTQAIGQAPENAGPLNSHMLVLRSLAHMRDTSPDYLKRFMSYVDTLLLLDVADLRNRAPVKRTPAKRAPGSKAGRK